MGPHLRPCCEPRDKLAQNAKITIEPTYSRHSCVTPSVYGGHACRDLEVGRGVRARLAADEDVLGQAIVRTPCDVELARAGKLGARPSIDAHVDLEEYDFAGTHAKVVFLKIDVRIVKKPALRIPVRRWWLPADTSRVSYSRFRNFPSLRPSIVASTTEREFRVSAR